MYRLQSFQFCFFFVFFFFFLVSFSFLWFRCARRCLQHQSVHFISSYIIQMRSMSFIGETNYLLIHFKSRSYLFWSFAVKDSVQHEWRSNRYTNDFLFLSSFFCRKYFEKICLQKVCSQFRSNETFDCLTTFVWYKNRSQKFRIRFNNFTISYYYRMVSWSITLSFSLYLI